jgi:spermidine/putrescine transport system ATP-binding protein
MQDQDTESDTTERESETRDPTQSDSNVLLRIEDLKKYFGDLCAVDAPELTLNNGEFFTLVGPSGSGKSTLLRMIAGLETPTEGRMLLDGTDITDVPPNERSTALIFQNFQLFPHKTVGENVEFPLKMRDVPKDERKERCQELLEFVDLGGYYDRYPDKLSGGEKQRVSLARGLIYEPDVLLLDEPLASLDRNLRDTLEVELRKYQRRLDVTFIYVTHDQEVALTMSDRVAVMNESEIVQVGEPMELYNEPASKFVATFLGEVNTIPGVVDTVEDGQATLKSGEVTLRGRSGASLEAADEGVFCVKSENLQLATTATDASRSIEGSVSDVFFTGKLIEYLIDPEGITLDDDDDIVVSVTRQQGPDLAIGDTVELTWDPENAHVFPEGE